MNKNWKSMIAALLSAAALTSFAEAPRTGAVEWALVRGWTQNGADLKGDAFGGLQLFPQNKTPLKNFTFEIKITPQKANYPQDWMTCGIGVFQSEGNFWGLTLVAQPEQIGKEHFIELKVYEDGKEAHQKLKCFNWKSFAWEYGKTYTLKLAVSGGKIAGSVEGAGQSGAFGFELGDCAVKEGIPFLRQSGLAVEYGEAVLTPLQ